MWVIGLFWYWWVVGCECGCWCVSCCCVRLKWFVIVGDVVCWWCGWLIGLG